MEFARLLAGNEDPLGINELCYDGLEAEGFLLDHFDLIDRMAAWLSSMRHEIRSAQEALETLPSILASAMRRAVEEDEERLRDGIPVEQPLPTHLHSLRSQLGVPEEMTAPACLALNKLPWKYRHAVLNAILLAKGYDGYERQYHVPEDVVRERLSEALVRMNDALVRWKGGLD